MREKLIFGKHVDGNVAKEEKVQFFAAKEQNTQETFISKGDLPLHLSTNKKRKHIEVW